MSVDEGLFEWVREALEPIGQVTKRHMMGAAVLYLDGIVFAVLDDQLWFKADKDSESIWDAEGCERFSFETRDGRIETMNYRQAPSDVYDDAEAMQRWAGLAVEAGRRGTARRKPRKPRKG